MTPASILSKWVERELDEALHEEVEGRKVVIPVLAAGLKQQNVPARLRKKNYVDLTYNFEAGYSKLHSSILYYMEEIGGVTVHPNNMLVASATTSHIVNYITNIFNTSGGAVIGGSVTAGGDFIGRNKEDNITDPNHV